MKLSTLLKKRSKDEPRSLAEEVNKSTQFSDIKEDTRFSSTEDTYSHCTEENKEGDFKQDDAYINAEYEVTDNDLKELRNIILQNLLAVAQKVIDPDIFFKMKTQLTKSKKLNFTELIKMCLFIYKNYSGRLKNDPDVKELLLNISLYNSLKRERKADRDESNRGKRERVNTEVLS